MNFQETIRKAAAEGAVLLRNENTLPLTSEDKISVFGRAQINYYRSGTGSGGSVNVPYTVNLIQGFEKLASEKFPVPELNKNLISIYEAWIKENPFNDGGGVWGAEPWTQIEMQLTEEMVKSAAEISNKALFVLGRTAGEDQDNRPEKGSFYLTDVEEENLKLVCKNFNKVVLVLNVANIIDLSWINDEKYSGHITAVIFSWQGGMEAGSGTADVLCGKVNPCGKLSDTIAYSWEDYPCSKYFGSATNEFYAEDIYVGYRYFSTFAKNKVQFPFGFGLSYSEFKITSIKYKLPDASLFESNPGNAKFSVQIEVKNCGTFAGKEVIQCYVKAPQGKLGKAKKVLAGFKKTALIEPGKTDTVEIEFDSRRFASYDDTGTTGFEYSYVLEEGVYSVYVGNSVAECKKILSENDKEFTLNKTIVVEKLSQNLAPEKAFEILKPGKLLADGMYEEAKTLSSENKNNLAEKIASARPEELKISGNRKIDFAEVIKDNSLVDDFVAQLSVNELETLARGEGMMSLKVTPGIASAFGGISEELHDKGIPAIGCCDGPSGIRLETGHKASLVPIGTMLACTWDPELVEQLYNFMGQEMSAKKIDVLLGPGCNIHRSPLNGRNFEYFSEDPLLTGIMAGSIVKGLAAQSGIGTIKHFALNNQETYRSKENSIASERAIREIYLKPFEIAICEYGALSVMTSYNAVNGHWCASNFELTDSILRGEWNYKGLVMTDWWATMNDCVKGGIPSASNLAQMIKARTNVYMVVANDTADKGGYGDNLHSEFEKGNVTLAELQRSAKDVLIFITKTYSAKHPLRLLKEPIRLGTDLHEVPAGKQICSLNEVVQIKNNECELYYKFEKPVYCSLQGTFFKDGGETLSQSITNIFVNEEPCGSFECRSTEGKPVSIINCYLELQPGVYRISLKHTKPGIDVRNLALNEIKTLK